MLEYAKPRENAAQGKEGGFFNAYRRRIPTPTDRKSQSPVEGIKSLSKLPRRPAC